MKTKIQNKISEKSSKIAWEVLSVVLFVLSLLLIFFCVGDGCYNGRLLLGLVLLISSCQADIKAGKEIK
jgi:hypothetical protein